LFCEHTSLLETACNLATWQNILIWYLVKELTVIILVIAVQRIRSTVNEREQKQLLMDLDVVMRSNECPYIVKFYGALFKEVCSVKSYFISEKYWYWNQ